MQLVHLYWKALQTVRFRGTCPASPIYTVDHSRFEMRIHAVNIFSGIQYDYFSHTLQLLKKTALQKTCGNAVSTIK